MKTHTSRTVRFIPSRLHQEAPAGQNGQQATPPAYGLEFTDNQELPIQPVMSDRQQASPAYLPPPNNTGLPDGLKAGVEQLSGHSMDDVKVHYNSSKPAQLHALAYAQGTDIHLGPRQEKHLPHEAWHVVQQKEGRVRPAMKVKNVAINDDQNLENEADRKGQQAAHYQERTAAKEIPSLNSPVQLVPVVQRVKISDKDREAIDRVRRYMNGEDSGATAQDLGIYNEKYRDLVLSDPQPAASNPEIPGLFGHYGAVPADPNDGVYEQVRVTGGFHPDPGDPRTELEPPDIPAPPFDNLDEARQAIKDRKKKK